MRTILLAQDVPCDGCTICCENDLIRIYPQHGDRFADYLIAPIPGGGMRLLHKPEGGCVYLGEHGCSIYPHRPFLCRQFDCRGLLRQSGKELARLIERGLLTQETVDAGRRMVAEEAEDG